MTGQIDCQKDALFHYKNQMFCQTLICLLHTSICMQNDYNIHFVLLFVLLLCCMCHIITAILPCSCADACAFVCQNVQLRFSQIVEDMSAKAPRFHSL